MNSVVVEGIDAPATNAATSVWRGLAQSEELIRRDVALGPLTTYKFGGPAAFYAEVGSSGELAEVVAMVVAAPLPLLILGRGSNLVVSDAGFPGLVLHLAGDFIRTEVLDDGSIRAGGAVPLPRLARAATKAARAGLEFFVGIPGSVGGAVQMNAGCLGAETADRLVEATIVDLATGQWRTSHASGLELAYRHSNLTRTDLVTEALFRTEAGTRESGEEELRDITAWRKRTQPGGTFNAGSVFKNPQGDAAGRIIDDLGLKGFRTGGVAVSEKHANFFVADETATAQDVYDLVHEVKARVLEATGVSLTAEVRFAGPFVVTDRSAQATAGGERP
jgi:UDP-N-acetylmuramate dehydrogenase